MKRGGEESVIYKPRKRHGTDPSLRTLKRNQPCQNLDFGLPDSSTLRQHIFVVYLTQVVVFCDGSPNKTQ